MPILLLIIALVLLALGMRRDIGADEPDRPDIRGAALQAAIVIGVVITLMTEILSAASLLIPATLGLGWALVAFAAGVFGWRRGGLARPLSLTRPTRFVGVACAIVASFALITFLLALISTPNSADSMTYHMARVMHWAQNHNVAPYPTHVTRQLFNPPWAETAMLHLALLAGDDRAANLVQWLSMIGSVVAVSAVARQLGAGGHGQALAAILCATLPMGILQASSTLNDYSAAFWLIVLGHRLLRLRARASVTNALWSGLALGLGTLTKSTVVIFAFPLAALFSIWVLLDGRRRLIRATTLVAIVGLTGALLNVPHYVRNLQSFSDLGVPGGSRAMRVQNEDFGPGTLISNVSRNVALHLGTPWPAVNGATEKLMERMHVLLGLDLNDRATTWRLARFEVPGAWPQEDRSGNPLHLVFIVLGLPTVLIAMSGARRTRVVYVAAGLAAFLLFCVILKWQPWHSRLQLPLFVLAMPIVGCALERWHSSLRILVAVIVTAFAVPFLIAHDLRPLVGPLSVARQTPGEMVLMDADELASGYRQVASVINKRHCTRVGILGAWNTYEYPLWVLVPSLRGTDGRLDSVGVDNRTARLRVAGAAPFEPCAVMVVGGPGQGRKQLTIDGRSYRRVWGDDTMRVVVPDDLFDLELDDGEDRR